MSKSNIPEVIIWGIYAVITGISLLGATVTYSNSLGYGTVLGVIFAILGAVLIALISGGLHKLSERLKLQELFESRKYFWVIVETLVLLGILLGMVFVRLQYSWNIAGDTVYESVMVKSGGAGFTSNHGGYGLYLYLVNRAFLLLGNRTYAPMVLQLILLVCASVALYFGVRKLAGVMPAILTVSFLGYAPNMVAESCSLTPFLVVLFFYGLALICIGGISYSMLQSNCLPDQIAALFCYMTSGMLIGLCCYLDVSGITLLVIMTAVVCSGDNLYLGDKENETLQQSSNKAGKTQQLEISLAKILGNPVLVFISIVLFAAFMFWCMHGDFVSLSRQLSLYVPGDFRLPVTVAESGSAVEGLVIVFLLVLGVFTFWFSGNMGKRKTWLFAAMLLAVMQCFGITALEFFNGYTLICLYCIILAGCGFADILMKMPQKEEGVREDFDMAIIDMDAPEEKAVKQDAVHEIEFIENPLPLPKKHVKKVMDYDIEVADDDDFDI